MVAAAFCLFICARPAEAVPSNNKCDLPRGLQREILSRFPGMRIVSSADLASDDKRFFEADHNGECPGLAKVDFYGDGKPTMALVLTSAKRTAGQSQLIVAHLSENKWELACLDTGGSGSTTPVVWSQPAGTYEDVYGNKTIRATHPVIVFCGYESWTILYAWTGNRVSKIWIAD